jgi:raffinose/stachyose/melibiose transport system substrate-binding protein
MKKLLMILVTFVAIFAFVGCGGTTTTMTTTQAAGTTTSTTAAQQTLTIFQNKVEIGDALTTYAQAWGAANNVNVTVTTCGGDSCAYEDTLVTQFAGAAADQPDIFVVEGVTGYETYADYIAPLTGADWLNDTTLAFKYNDVVYGFPVSVEGWGLAYNRNLLDAAGVDPGNLTSLSAYDTAFQAIQAYYDANNMTDYTVVDMAAGAGMTWVTGLHNFNGYLSSGLAYGDSTVIDKLNNGVVDATRLQNYADWVTLIFDYSNQDILVNGTYDDQVNLFASGKAAFIHQGNWIDPNLVTYFKQHPSAEEFPMGFAPAAAASGTCDSVFIAAPSYYVVNSNKGAAQLTLAQKFFSDMVYTDAGQQYIVNKAGMLPAFTNINLTPTGPLSSNLAKWLASGKMYSWWQNNMPAGFGMNTLGPIFTAYAQGDIDETQFISQVTTAIEAIPSS